MAAVADTDSLAAVRLGVEHLRAGGAVVLVDDARRCGELVVAADGVTAGHVNLLVREARGILCLALPERRCDALGLREMPRTGDPPRRFAVSIEAREGVTTGISAADRARTVQAAMAPEARPRDLTAPGHIMPLIVRGEGLGPDAGLPEAAVQLTRWAGLAAGALMCTVLDRDGDVAGPGALAETSARLGLPMVSVSDVVARWYS